MVLHLIQCIQILRRRTLSRVLFSRAQVLASERTTGQACCFPSGKAETADAVSTPTRVSWCALRGYPRASGEDTTVAYPISTRHLRIPPRLCSSRVTGRLSVYLSVRPVGQGPISAVCYSLAFCIIVILKHAGGIFLIAVISFSAGPASNNPRLGAGPVDLAFS